jgi:hypothetical protein
VGTFQPIDAVPLEPRVVMGAEHDDFWNITKYVVLT